MEVKELKKQQKTLHQKKFILQMACMNERLKVIILKHASHFTFCDRVWQNWRKQLTSPCG